MMSNPEPIKDILVRILAENPHLNGLIRDLQPSSLAEFAPEELQAIKKIQVLNSYVTWHIPSRKLEQAEIPLQKMAKPFGGFNCLPSVGGWVDDDDNWEIEDIQLVTAFTNVHTLNRQLLSILVGSYHLGRFLQESAIGLEVGTPMQKSMLIIPTK